MGNTEKVPFQLSWITFHKDAEMFFAADPSPAQSEITFSDVFQNLSILGHRNFMWNLKSDYSRPLLKGISPCRGANRNKCWSTICFDVFWSKGIWLHLWDLSPSTIRGCLPEGACPKQRSSKIWTEVVWMLWQKDTKRLVDNLCRQHVPSSPSLFACKRPKRWTMDSSTSTACQAWSLRLRVGNLKCQSGKISSNCKKFTFHGWNWFALFCCRILNQRMLGDSATGNPTMMSMASTVPPYLRW